MKKNRINSNLVMAKLFKGTNSELEIDDTRALLNGNPTDYNDKLFLISAPVGNFGYNIALLWANNEQDAFDIACDENLLDGWLVEDNEIENEEEIIRLGNASDAFDLQDATITRVPDSDWKSDYDYVFALGAASECGPETLADV
jgi:hypothetical protein